MLRTPWITGAPLVKASAVHPDTLFPSVQEVVWCPVLATAPPLLSLCPVVCNVRDEKMANRGGLERGLNDDPEVAQILPFDSMDRPVCLGAIAVL